MRQDNIIGEKPARIDQGIQTEVDISETPHGNWRLSETQTHIDSTNTSINTHLNDTMMPEEPNMETEYPSPIQIVQQARVIRGRPPKANRESLIKLKEETRRKRARLQ